MLVNDANKKGESKSEMMTPQNEKEKKLAQLHIISDSKE